MESMSSSQNNLSFFRTILLALAVIAIIITAYFYFREDLIAIPKKQLEEITQGNDNNAYYAYTSEEFQESSPFDSFQTFLDLHPIFRKNPSLNLSVFEQTNHEVTLRGSLLLSDNSSQAIEYKLIKENGSWKIQTITLLDMGPKNNLQETSTFESLQRPINLQLDALKQKNISEAYYELVSEEFQRKTPYKDFEAFAIENPILSTFTKSNVISYKIDGNEADLTLKLQNDSDDVLIEYRLIRSKGDWKIWNLHLVVPETENTSTVQKTQDAREELIAALDAQDKPSAKNFPALLETNNLKESIEKHLESIRAGDVLSAYNGFTSQEFKKSNSLDSFQNFIKTYPILSNAAPHISSVESNNRYGSIKVDFDTATAHAEVNYLFIKEGNDWKILAIDINSQTKSPVANPQAEISKEAPPPSKTDLDPQELLLPVQQLLANIRYADFSAAYKYYMTEGFQKTTPYEKFHQVLERLPAITQGSVTYSQPKIEGENGFLTAEFTSPFGKANLDFILVREKNNWKIQALNISGATTPGETPTGIPITEKPSRAPSEKLNISSIEYPIQMQFYLISSGDINRSYFDLTSLAFQRSTTLQEYSDFIKGYAVFTDNADYTIQNHETNPENATLKVTATSHKGEKATISYDLTFENTIWKISNIQILDYLAPPKGLSQEHRNEITENEPASSKEYSSPAALIRLAPIQKQLPTSLPAPQGPSLNISYGVFGTKINEQGLIKEPILIIPKGKENIYFNLFIENAKQNDTITLNFKHLNTGTTIPEIRSNIRHEGSSTLSFIFAPPTEGWPEGVYEVTAIPNRGEGKIFNFRVQ